MSEDKSKMDKLKEALDMKKLEIKEFEALRGKKLCKLCQKPLTKIGRMRQNGKGHNDWPTREYHKQCWKNLQIEKPRIDPYTYKLGN